MLCGRPGRAERPREAGAASLVPERYEGGITTGQLVAYEFVTLDGVIQAPGGPDEDREGGFEHGGWQAPYGDAETGQLIAEHYSRVKAILLGRKTYENFAAYWSQAPADNPFTKVMNGARKYVASSTLESVEWENSRLLAGDVPAEVARLKEMHDEVQLIGSGDFLQTLLQHDLVDRLHLWIYPLLLGTGKRLFAGGTIPAALRLATSQTFASGAVFLTFEFAGKPTYGALDR